MATYTFTETLVWDVAPGRSVKVLANAPVTVKNASTSAVLFTVTTDNNGQVSFSTTDVPTVILSSGTFTRRVTSQDAIESAAGYTVSEDAAIAANVNNSASATRSALDGKYVGRVRGLVANDSTSATKAANAAVLAAALVPNASVIIPAGTYYTNEISVAGPITIKGEGMAASALRNDAGSVLVASGTKINVSDITIRSGGGNHTVRQSGAVDQGRWDKVTLWQDGTGYSIWANAGYMFIDMRFSSFLSWHSQSATVPSWNLVSIGGNVNNNVWSQFRAQFSGNYHFNVESTDVNSQHANVWRDATWEVTTGGMIRLIGCRDYVIDNSTVWDLLAGAGGVTTLKKDGIFADTNASGALCIGRIQNHRRLDSTVDAGFYDIKLPSGTAKGAGTVLERCQNITSANPLTVNLNGNDCLILNPGSSASTLTTYTNASAAQIIDKGGVSIPSGQTIQIGGQTLVGLGLLAGVGADPASIPANSELDVALTVTGAQVGDACSVSTSSALEAGLGIVGCWATANTVTFRLRNFTGSAIDPGSRTWRVRVWR